MKSVTSDLFQRSHYGKEEQNSQREYWSRLSHITRILYIHIWTDFCWAVYFPPADWKSLPLPFSVAQLAGSQGWMEGFTDRLIQKDTICKPGGKWERGWHTVYSCWQKVRYWQYWYSLAHFFLLASLPTSHQFLILLSGNVDIPAVKSHCWIWFHTTLCWEHIEIKTHGDCYCLKVTPILSVSSRISNLRISSHFCQAMF